ncbi:MAG TPA: DUF721 domain-containing protein [Edaphocola sp.]|nr:DUF721 domain-containing protein [Edaphocola sp.]
MASISLGEAIKQVMESSGWKARLQEIKLKRDWETIVGVTIAKYTQSISLRDGILIINTTVAPLKQELHYGKEQLKANINEFYKERIIADIIVK